MNAFKYLGLLLFALLTACAPKPQVINNPLLKIPGEATTPSAPLTPIPDNIAPGTATIPTTNDAKTDKTKAIQNSSTLGKTAANSISSWELSGAMAARNKNKAWSASINWVQRGASNYQIRLFGPLGSGTILVERQGNMISYRDGPKSSTSSNAEQLLMKETGVRLPVNSLYYWVRGVPAPGSVQSAAKDSSGFLTVLKQGGYTIQYLSYAKAGNAYLPSHIKLQGNGVSIKLVIKRWRV